MDMPRDQSSIESPTTERAGSILRRSVLGKAGRKWALLLVAAVAVTVGVAVWQLSSPGREVGKYRTEPARITDVTQSVSANGTLNPVVLVNVGTQVSGTVKRLLVDFNDYVQKDQVLVELDPAIYEAQVKQSEANLANARSQLELAEANEARMKALLEKEYVARQDYDTSTQALKAARAQVALASAQLDKDRTNLAYTVIRSPVAGVVVSRQVDVGQTVAASFQTPTLFQIAQDLSRMQIDSAFAEADVGVIRVGQPVLFRVDAFPNRTFQGEVRQVRLNPTTQQNVVTYDVVVSVANPLKILLPGMTAYVNIIVARRSGVLLVPNAALRFRPADSTPRRGPSADQGAEPPRDAKGRGGGGGVTGTVFVIENDRPKAIRVNVGITDNRYTEITGGDLKEGDAVIVEDRQPPAKGPSGPGMRLF